MSPLGTFFPGGLLPGGGLLFRGSFARGTFSPGGFCLGALLAGGTFGRGDFCPGSLLPGGTFGQGDFCPGGVFCPGGLCPFPQVQCAYAPSRLSVPSIVAWRTNKKRQTWPRSSAGSWPPLPKFSGYVEVEAHYIFHQSTIWVRPLFMELGPEKKPKSRFCHEANEYVALAVR